MNSISSGFGITTSTPRRPNIFDSTVERVPNSATRLSPRARTASATICTMSISGMFSSGSSCAEQMCGVTATIAAISAPPAAICVDEAVEIARKLVELAGFRERAAVIDVRVRDQHARDASVRLMRRDQAVVVVNRRVRPEPADQAEEAAVLSGHDVTSAECRHSAPGTARACAISPYQRSRFAIFGRSGTSSM